MNYVVLDKDEKELLKNRSKTRCIKFFIKIIVN